MQKIKHHFMTISIIICLIISSMVYTTYCIKDVQSQKLKIGASYMTMNNTFYRAINNEIKKVVNENGDILYVRDPALDVSRQADQIYDLVDKGIDVLIIVPGDSKYIEKALKYAKSKDVKIIVVDAPIEDKSIADCTIVSDNYDAGVQCAKDMMSKIERGNIVLLEHESVISARDRIQGFVDTINNNDQYKIIDRADCLGQTELALPRMRELISRNEHIDVVMALNDPSALGALAALEEAHINDVLVYGIDGAPDMKKLIQDTNEVQATASQSPTSMGKNAIEVAYKMKNNEKYKKEIIIPTKMITKDNISNYTLSGWQ